jgi:hypothetical protein
VTAVLVIIPGICYALASVLYGREGNWPLSVVYAGYFIGNCGLLWLDLTLKR